MYQRLAEAVLFGYLPLSGVEQNSDLEGIPAKDRDFVLRRMDHPKQEMDFRNCAALTIGHLCYRLGVGKHLGRSFLLFRVYSTEAKFLLTLGVKEQEIATGEGAIIRSYALLEGKECRFSRLPDAVRHWHGQVGSKWKDNVDTSILGKAPKTWLYFSHSGETNAWFAGLYAV